MKIPHTHDSGADCLACDLQWLRESTDNQWHNYRAREALDRIEAALAEREHLEEGATLLRDGQRIGSPNEFATRWHSWLEAERARKAEKA